MSFSIFIRGMPNVLDIKIHVFKSDVFQQIVFCVVLLSVQRLKRMLESALDCEELSGKKHYTSVNLLYVYKYLVDHT